MFIKKQVLIKVDPYFKKECKRFKIDFMTIYDLEYVDQVYKDICAYKIGSRRYKLEKIIKKLRKKKTSHFSTGASSLKMSKNW